MYNDSSEEHITITEETINAVPKSDIFEDDEMNQRVHDMCKALLTECIDDPPFTERAYSIALSDLRNGEAEPVKTKGEDGEGTVNIPSLDEPYISIHNHPSGETFSTIDIERFFNNKNAVIVVVVGNNGNVYTMSKDGSKANTTSAYPYLKAYSMGYIKAESDADFYKGLMKYGIEYKEYA